MSVLCSSGRLLSARGARALRPLPQGRHLALAAVDPVVVIGDRRWRLGVHEWADGTVAPDGHVHLESFSLRDGLPVWRWSLGDVVVERKLAVLRGRPAVEAADGGFSFGGAWRMRGPGCEPAGSWYRGAHHRAEAERGLNPVEDLWHRGRFATTLSPGGEVGVEPGPAAGHRSRGPWPALLPRRRPSWPRPGTEWRP